MKPNSNKEVEVKLKLKHKHPFLDLHKEVEVSSFFKEILHFET